MITVDGKALVAGVWLDESRGHWLAASLIETALSFGWQDETAADVALDYERRYWDSEWQHGEIVGEIADEALEYLNSRTEGGTWTWDERGVVIEAA